MGRRRTNSGEMIQRNWDDAIRSQNEMYDRVNTNLPGAVDRSNDAYNRASGGFQSVLDRFDVNKPGRLETMYGSNAKKYGTWDPDRVAGIDREFDRTGETLDRSERTIGRSNKTLDTAEEGLKNFDDIAGRYRNFADGNTEQGRYYGDLLKTGGFDETERADFRSRGTAVIPAMYDSYKRENDRLNAVTGGINPGFTGSTALLGREAAQAGQDAATDTEVRLQEAIRQGELTGAGALDDTFLQGQAGELNARNTESNQRLNLSSARNAIANLMMSLGGARLNLGQARQGLGRDLSESSRLLSGMMVDEDNMRAGNVLNASQGLTGLRSSTPGEVNMWLDYLLQGDSMYNNIRGQSTNARASQEASGRARKEKIAKVAAAAAATYFTGGAASPLLVAAASENTDRQVNPYSNNHQYGMSTDPRLNDNSNMTVDQSRSNDRRMMIGRYLGAASGAM